MLARVNDVGVKEDARFYEEHDVLNAAFSRIFVCFL
jgi:hypothetical protein